MRSMKRTVFRSFGLIIYLLSTSSCVPVSASVTMYDRRHSCIHSPRLAERPALSRLK